MVADMEEAELKSKLEVHVAATILSAMRRGVSAWWWPGTAPAGGSTTDGGSAEDGERAA